MSNRMSDTAREIKQERRIEERKRTTYIRDARRNKQAVQAAFGGAR